MKKFLKLAIIPMAFLTLSSTTSCSVRPREIALITDVGDIDDGSFNQESWEAIKEYATENNKSYDFYRPFNDSDFARDCAVKQAVAKGAKVVVMPGFKFANSATSCMKKFPNVHFLLIDSPFNEAPTSNACAVGFKPEYSGFLAGYTISQDLMRRDLKEKKSLDPTYGYGYAGGMAIPGVFEFGFGFIEGVCQGSAAICEEENLNKQDYPQLHFKYTYSGAFAQDDKTATKVKGWYLEDGKNIKVVFPCGGKLYQSITEAAQYYNKHNVKNYQQWIDGKLDKNPREAARWVGVDSDQYKGLKYNQDKKSIYTSALKGLKKSIIHTLNFHYADEWQRIGGIHQGSEGEGKGEIPGGGYQSNYQWILGLKSVFGEFDVQTEEEFINKDNYVGIPDDAYDEKTRILRGFDNFTIEQYQDLLEQDLTVYGGDGSEYIGSSKACYPDGMRDWYKEVKEEGKTEKIYFSDEYFGEYPREKIDEIKTV